MPLDLALYHEELDQRTARLLALLADPVRLRLLHLLDAGLGATADLAQRLCVSEAEVAGHLEHLVHAGLVQGEGHTARHACVDARIIDALLTLRRHAAHV